MSVTELGSEPIVKLRDLVGGLSLRLDLRRCPTVSAWPKAARCSIAISATASPCTATAARASARRRVAPGGIGVQDNEGRFARELRYPSVVPIARKSRMPGRHGMRIRSAAFAAAKDALSACGAVSISARVAPPSCAA